MSEGKIEWIKLWPVFVALLALASGSGAQQVYIASNTSLAQENKGDIKALEKRIDKTEEIKTDIAVQKVQSEQIRLEQERQRKLLEKIYDELQKGKIGPK